MTSVLVIMGRIYRYQFKYNNLKKQAFWCFFIAFSESTLNFEHFDKHFEPHSLSISEIIDFEKRDYRNAKKVLFRKTFR